MYTDHKYNLEVSRNTKMEKRGKKEKTSNQKKATEKEKSNHTGPVSSKSIIISSLPQGQIS